MNIFIKYCLDKNESLETRLSFALQRLKKAREDLRTMRRNRTLYKDYKAKVVSKQAVIGQWERTVNTLTWQANAELPNTDFELELEF
jgi:hypothetical protein